MRITLSERGTPDWQTAADLARLVFAKQYQASISPDPDGFLAFFETAADGQEEVLACAGLSFPEEESILLERYLDAPVEDVITRAVGAPVKRSQVLQIGSIASVRAAAGAEIIKAIPLIMACLGRPYAVMTMTGRLAALMQRLGCVFHPSPTPARNACPKANGPHGAPTTTPGPSSATPRPPNSPPSCWPPSAATASPRSTCGC
ncbi:thermostable hemolysin [Streptomyces sp. RLB1-33]